MIDLDKRFCGAVSYEIQQYVNNKTNQTTFSNYLPQRVIFSHLQTTEPLLRVSCGFSPSGQYYAHYYVANNSKLIALSEIPLIIHNNAEAKEFVLYFTYGSGSGIYPLLSKDSYDGFTEKCNLTLEPPLKGIGIEKSEDSNSFIVQITIDDGNSGTIEYQKLSVEALEHDYKADVKENIVIGQCGPVI